MTKPFFSVMVPVYNVKMYLDRCVQSLLDQTFGDSEIILVNDGSTDGSGSLCDQWQAKYPDRIRVVHQKNQGLLMARTTGFREAKGRYFVAVDSDDMLHPRALETFHDYICRYNADVVLYHASRQEDYSVPLRELPFRDGEVMNVRNHEVLRRMAGATFELNNLVTKVFRRELAQVQPPERAHISQGEDLVYSLPVMDGAERVVYCDRVFYYYRPNPTSITRTYKPTLFRSMRDVLRIQREYALKWDPSGVLAQECDVNGLWHFFDDVIARIMRSQCTRQEKNRYMLEMVTDPDFIRDYALIGKIPSLKARVCLRLAKNRCFWPMYLYGTLKNKLSRE